MGQVATVDSCGGYQDKMLDVLRILFGEVRSVHSLKSVEHHNQVICTIHPAVSVSYQRTPMECPQSTKRSRSSARLQSSSDSTKKSSISSSDAGCHLGRLDRPMPFHSTAYYNITASKQSIGILRYRLRYRRRTTL